MCYILGGCSQSSCINLLYLNIFMKMKILKRKDGTAVVTIKKSQGKVNSQRHWIFPTKGMGSVGFFQPLKCWRFPLGKCENHCWWHREMFITPCPGAWNSSPRCDNSGSVWCLLHLLHASFSSGAGALVCVSLLKSSRGRKAALHSQLSD